MSKEDKKAAVKVCVALFVVRDTDELQEKVEKTKVEGKGFFAKLFGGNKSPKKEKKVKTPKVRCWYLSDRTDGHKDREGRAGRGTHRDRTCRGSRNSD